MYIYAFIYQMICIFYLSMAKSTIHIEIRFPFTNQIIDIENVMQQLVNIFGYDIFIILLQYLFLSIIMFVYIKYIR